MLEKKRIQRELNSPEYIKFWRKGTSIKNSVETRCAAREQWLKGIEGDRLIYHLLKVQRTQKAVCIREILFKLAFQPAIPIARPCKENGIRFYGVSKTEYTFELKIPTSFGKSITLLDKSISLEISFLFHASTLHFSFYCVRWCGVGGASTVSLLAFSMYFVTLFHEGFCNFT